MLTQHSIAPSACQQLDLASATPSGSQDHRLNGVQLPHTGIVHQAPAQPLQHTGIPSPLERWTWARQATQAFQLTAPQSRVLLEHCLRAGTTKGSFVSAPIMAEETGLGVRTVKRSNDQTRTSSTWAS